MGAVHMPEEELRAFLRVFVPQEQIEAALDTVALLGLEAEVTQPLELFAIAHLEVARDPRVTREAEAVVLVEEAGLSAAEVGVVLGMAVPEVETAVAAAWEGLAEAERPAGSDRPAECSGGAELEQEPAGEAGHGGHAGDPGDDPSSADLAEPADDMPVEADDDMPVEADDDVPVEAAGRQAGEPTPGAGQTAPAGVAEGDRAADPSAAAVIEAPAVVVARRSPLRWLVGAGAAVLVIAVLTVAAFSSAGQQRLRLLGLDPLVLIGLMMLLIVGGLALARAGSDERFTDQVLDGSAEEAPAAGEQGHDRDQQDRQDHQPEGDQGGVAETRELERLVEDVER